MTWAAPAFRPLSATLSISDATFLPKNRSNTRTTLEYDHNLPDFPTFLMQKNDFNAIGFISIESFYLKTGLIRMTIPLELEDS